MSRAIVFKQVSETFKRIYRLKKAKILKIGDTSEQLDGKKIKLWKGKQAFNFEFIDYDTDAFSMFDNDFNMLFSENDNGEVETTYTFLPHSFETVNIKLEDNFINGEITSIIESSKFEFNDKYLRLVQEIDQTPKIFNISESKDVRTKKGITHSGGYNSFKILETEIDTFITIYRNKYYLIIDSKQKLNVELFDKISDAFHFTYSYVFGETSDNEAYILSSNNSSFNEIENVMFFKKSESKNTNNSLFNQAEILSNKLSKEFVFFPNRVISEIANNCINSDEFYRTIIQVQEAIFAKNPIQKCILFSSALETISNLIHEKSKITPIDNERFEKSKIIESIEKVISENKILSKEEKVFLIKKKIAYINSPTNADKLESPFVFYKIKLPEHLRKALKYRNPYLHGSMPRINDVDKDVYSENYKRAEELHILTNILILKYSNYSGFIRNNAAWIEYYNYLAKDKIDKFKPSQSIYYEI